MSTILHGRIDVHHHLIPPAFVDAMRARGLTTVAGAPLPEWTPRSSLRVMDAHGIQTALLSLSAPGVYFGDAAQAVSLARACNDHAAGVAAEHPGRFGWFATLPMPLTGPACAEAVHALDMLKADGVVLLGSSDGVFLGDPRFEELMAELDRRAATVFLHPNLHPGTDALGLVAPGFLVEFVCDTTRAALNLILTGTLERYPRIRWILAHAGGFLPYIAWRTALANGLPQFAERAPQGVLHYIRRLYFDTALSPSPFAMAALRELVEPSHILFGSDFPFAPAAVTALQVRELDTNPVLDDATRRRIVRAHALALFPRLAQADERPDAPPVYVKEGAPARLRRALARRVGALAQRMVSR